MSKTINELVRDAHNNSVAKGFWDDVPFEKVSWEGVPAESNVRVMGPSLLAEKLCLIHSEVSEALEDVRDGKMLTRYLDKETGRLHVFGTDGSNEPILSLKPVGFPSEMADIVIRVFDLCGALGIDLQKEIERKMAHNATRTKKHGRSI